MRPIDAEKFDMVAFDYFDIRDHGFDNTFSDGVQWLAEQLDEAPTLDVVPAQTLRDIAEFVEDRMKGVCQACNNYEVCKASGKSTRGSHQNCWQSFMDRFDKDASVPSKTVFESIKQGLEEAVAYQNCPVCKNIERGDTLYSCSDWDGGIGFDYIRDIQYCPACGRKL